MKLQLPLIKVFKEINFLHFLFVDDNVKSNSICENQTFIAIS